MPTPVVMKENSIYKLYFILVFVALTACIKKGPEAESPTRSIEPFYDLALTQPERDSLLDGLTEDKKAYEEIHRVNIENNIPMALFFDPLPQGYQINERQERIEWKLPQGVELPASREELAFYPVFKLASLIKERKITSTELTKLYLSRLKKYGDTLKCVVTLTEETALLQAEKADEEIARGHYRGPLHGIPYGIKDLLTVEGTKTTWGAGPYKNQTLRGTATVVEKLEDAGAVLVAKLTLGALAMGDIWFGGKTRNPWNLEQGSSGSSAGSAAATAAGLVAFAIGTETWGSIVSPSTRCGTTGLRPTFGAVSRTGAMTLSWSMDKIGPICRSALDCGLVLNAIRGKDGVDRATKNFAFNYDAGNTISKLKIGYFKDLFDKDTANREQNNEVLRRLTQSGATLEPLQLPGNVPVAALSVIISAESAAAFDELTRSNRDSLLTDQRKGAWPNAFRTARFIPAVEYINALRLRKMLQEEYHSKLKDYDVIITPSFAGDQLLMTNLTGHPCLVVPDGFNDKGSPVSISFLGKLYGEAALITIGRAYQDGTEWDEKIPPLFRN